MEKKCLKCGHVHQAETIKPDSACPKCGAIYAKVESAIARSVNGASPQSTVKTSQPGMGGRFGPLQRVGAVVAIAVVGVLAYQAYRQYEEKRKQQEKANRISQIEEEMNRNNAAMQRAATEYLLKTLKAGLKDPASAQFTDLREYTHGKKLGDGRVHISTYVVCGQINAKNSFGGYVGARPFHAETTVQNGSLSEELTYVKMLDLSSTSDVQRGLEEARFAASVAQTCRDEIRSSNE